MKSLKQSKKLLLVFAIALVLGLCACGKTEKTVVNEGNIELADGVYLADFTTDSTMFHVNEACDGKGILYVTDHKAYIHIVLTSKNIVNLYLGLAEDAKSDEVNWIQPTVEEVTYSDGFTDSANAFDVTVPFLDEEFDLAIIGKKEVWYDHKVYVSNPVLFEDVVKKNDNTSQAEAIENTEETTQAETEEYTFDYVEVALEGGSGKATVDTQASIRRDEEGIVYATVTWSSPNYDYMIVNEEKYLPINTEGNSVFEIPIEDYECSMAVIADTVAMSKPHEIEYTLTFKKAK